MPEIAADADIGFGTEFHRFDATLATPDYELVGQLVDITPPNLTRDTFDRTHHQSPKRFREFGAALLDAGEMSLSVQMSGPGGLTSFIEDMTTAEVVKYKMVWPDATEWLFDGYVIAVTPETPIDDKQMASITIKLTGVPAFVEAAIA